MGYAVIAFSVFNKFFHEPAQGLFCDTLFACFVTVVRLGALANPPLGDVSKICRFFVHDNFHLTLQNIRIDGQYIALSLFRLAYGISYFIVVTTLGLNVVIAILVDNFSALRQTKVSEEKLMVICMTRTLTPFSNRMKWNRINRVSVLYVVSVRVI